MRGPEEGLDPAPVRLHEDQPSQHGREERLEDHARRARVQVGERGPGMEKHEEPDGERGPGACARATDTPVALERSLESHDERYSPGSSLESSTSSKREARLRRRESLEVTLLRSRRLRSG